MFDASTIFGSAALLIARNPLLVSTQLSILLLLSLVLFLLFYALRDILLRTRSLPYQFLCILLVAALPVAGFLLYLLIRPARTLAQRETDRKIGELWELFHGEEEGEGEEEKEQEDEKEEKEKEATKKESPPADDPAVTLSDTPSPPSA